MDSRDVQFRYKETRLNLEPASASSVVEIRISPASSSHGRHPSIPRAGGARNSSEADEHAWRCKHLATAASIYHRKHHSSPRSFLWRVLENGAVLSLRAADICKQEKDADAPLVLNLRFPSPVRESCVGFCDPANHDSLNVFAVDHANNLYSITLRPELFRRRSLAETGLGDACKSYSPPGFSFKHPHRLVAVSSDQLIVTMHDGGILRFDRNRSSDVATSNVLWKETIYNVAGWGQSLRGLVPFQRSPTVRYDKVNMELTAATSAAVTSMGHQGTSFLFTICLDHRMRVWDVRSGQILFTGDILNNAKRDPHEVGKWTIDPSQSNLIRIQDISRGRSLAVTFSPLGAGEFKLWKVKANDQGSILVADLFPSRRLIPSPPSSSDVWTLADFGLGSLASQEVGFQLWTLWKNNTTYRVQTLRIRPNSSAGPWSEGWKGVRIENAVPYAQTSGPCDPTDSSERWLSEIFFPGRYPRSTLETALAIYEKGIVGPLKEAPSKPDKPLAQAICSVVGSLPSLERNAAGGLDYEKYRANGEVHWRRFYRLLSELDKQRGEALSLVLDPEGGIWVVCADCLCAVRECSSLELVCHNLAAPEKNAEDVATLVQAGLTFLESFSDGMWQLSRATLASQMFEDPAQTDEERLQYFSDKAGFWRQITEEDCANVVDSLGQNFRIVTPRLYEDLFDLVTAGGDESNREPRRALTALGGKLAVRAVQDTAELYWQILFSQLILLVHMEFEFDSEEDALHGRVDVGGTYRRLVNSLRRLEHVKWMVRTEVSLPVSGQRPGSIQSPAGLSPVPSKSGSNDDAQVVTVLEALVGHSLGLPEVEDRSLSSSITGTVTNLCCHDSDIELLPHLHQCFLLRLDRPDLALDLSPLTDQDPLSMYVQGRVFLALNDYDAASSCFKKAAIGLSIPRRHVERHSSRLLDEMEWNLLNSGLPNYYSHIVNLYDKQKAYSHVIDFARLALQFARSGDDDTLAVRTDMLSRLFIASTAVSRFDVAQSSLLMMENEVLQRSYLKKLVEKMCETGQSRELVALPFAGLQDKIDDALLEKCRAARDVVRGPPYHQILYAWRVSQNDYRGAAVILHDRLQKLRQAGEGDKLAGTGLASGEDTLDTQVTRQYLMLINALSCLDPKQAFILEDSSSGEPGHDQPVRKPSETPHLGEIRAIMARNGPGGGDAQLDQLAKVMSTAGACNEGSERKVMTLGDVRKQYQEELDRIVAIQNDQYAYTPGEDEEMDIL